jgi:hypothetical protein
MDICKHDRDVEPIFEDEDSFVGVGCFDNFEPSSPDHIDRIHADQELVFNDQNHVPLCF